MFSVVTANVGELDRVAGDVCVDCQGWSIKGVLPAVDQALVGLDQAVLGDGIEKAYQVVIDCVKIHGNWCVVKIVVEMMPQLWNGELSW